MFYFWSGVFAIALLAESKRHDYQAICIGFGAIAALLCVGLGLPESVQILSAVLVSAIALVIAKRRG